MCAVLAGDSTVTDTAGWGAAFAKRLAPNAECVNLSSGGQSSKSFRDAGGAYELAVGDAWVRVGHHRDQDLRAVKPYCHRGLNRNNAKLVKFLELQCKLGPVAAARISSMARWGSSRSASVVARSSANSNRRSRSAIAASLH